MRLSYWVITLAWALPACAQGWRTDWYPKHNFTVSAGAARPRADLGSLLEDSPVFGFQYGYRFHKNFQADVGLDSVYGAARVRDFLETGFGNLRIRDFQFLVPFGGRAILPLGTDRLVLSGGGGGAYMRYQERVRQPFGGDIVRVDCWVCTARHGVGAYALVNVKGALDRNQHFWLGVTGKSYWGHTNGDPLGPIPGVRTRDQWYVITADFSFAF